MFFDRYEIHIQAFEEILMAKWMSGDSSFLTSHDFIILDIETWHVHDFLTFLVLDPPIFFTLLYQNT